MPSTPRSWSANSPAFARRRSRELRSEGFAGEPEIAYSINMRYLGQNYEHEVPIPSDAMTAGQFQAAYDAFIQSP